MWKIDTSKTGISSVFVEYQYEIIKILLATEKGITTGQMHTNLRDLDIIISRASVIIYLKKLAENGVANFREETGKGGYRRVYSTDLSLEQIITKIVNEVLVSLLNAFPSSDYLKFLTEEG